MTTKEPVRLSVNLSEDSAKALRDLSAREGKSIAEIVRDAFDGKRTPPTSAPRTRLIIQSVIATYDDGSVIYGNDREVGIVNTTPLKNGDRVLMVGTIVEPEPGATREGVPTGVIPYPLDEATVERLARAGHERVVADCGYDNPDHGSESIAWDRLDDDVRDESLAFARGVIAAMIEGAQG